MQWPGFVTFTWDGMTHTSDHHGLSHRNGSVAVGGTCAENVIENINADRHLVRRPLREAGHLISSITEGEASMLDNSAVMWLPELADGNAHNNNNLPIVIAGSAGGYLKQGVSVNLDTKTLGTGNSEASCANGNTSVGFNTGSNTGNVPLNKLYVTLLNAIGSPRFPTGSRSRRSAPLDTTGDVPKGITNPGEPTRAQGVGPRTAHPTRLPLSSLIRGSSVLSPPLAAAKGSSPASHRSGAVSGSSTKMRIAAVSSRGNTSSPCSSASASCIPAATA